MNRLPQMGNMMALMGQRPKKKTHRGRGMGKFPKLGTHEHITKGMDHFKSGDHQTARRHLFAAINSMPKAGDDEMAEGEGGGPPTMSAPPQSASMDAPQKTAVPKKLGPSTGSAKLAAALKGMKK